MAVATDLRAIILRYFNPIGSDPDLESGIYAKEPSHVARPAGDGGARAEGLLHRSPAPTTRPATAPASATTSTSGTSRGPTCAPSSASTGCSAQSGRPSVDHQRRPRRRASRSASWSPPSSGSSGTRYRSTEAPPRPGDAVGAFANVDRSARAPRLADRALHRRGDRLGAGLGRPPPGSPGLRVTRPVRRRPWPRAVARRVGGSGGPGVGDPRLPADRAVRRDRGSSLPLSGRTVVIDPGHQLGNHNYLGRDRPAGAGRWVPEAVQHHRHRDRRRLPGGDLHLAGVAAAEATGSRRSGATVRADPPLQPRRTAGARASTSAAGPATRIPADLKISIHGDGSYAAGAHGFHVIAPTDRKPWTHDIYRSVAPAGRRHPGRPAWRGAVGGHLHRRR